MNDTPARGKSQARKSSLSRNRKEPNSRRHGQHHGAGSALPAEAVHFPPGESTDLPADLVLKRLYFLGLRVDGTGPWQAICPTHNDTKPSLSLGETAEGVLLVRCWGGCDTEVVLESLGLKFKHLYPSLYALQFNKDRPRAALTYPVGNARGGGEVIEPTDEECSQWKRRLKAWPIRMDALKRLAAHLDLPRKALASLGVGYSSNDKCWIFPERADKQHIVGLVRRYPDGRKRALPGSRRGLTIPNYGKKRLHGPLYLVEGASDTAALVSVGAFAVGRSNAAGGASERCWLASLVRKHPGREIIVVGDREEGGAGERGAAQLASFLNQTLDRPVAWALPRRQYKDIREQVVAEKWQKGLDIKEIFQ